MSENKNKQAEFNSGLFRSSIIKRMKQSDLSSSARLVLLALLDHAFDYSSKINEIFKDKIKPVFKW